MATLTTIYWLCFGIGLVYVLVAGTLGAISHGLESTGDIDHDFDADHDFDVDHDFDIDHDAGFDIAADHDYDVGAADFDMGIPDADLAADADASVDADLDSGAEGGHDLHGGHTAVSDMPDWNPFSPLSIAGFLCAFGGGGLLATGYGWPLGLNLATAVVGGVLMSFVLWLVIGKFLFGMQGTSQARQIDMIGLEILNQQRIARKLKPLAERDQPLPQLRAAEQAKLGTWSRDFIDHVSVRV